MSNEKKWYEYTGARYCLQTQRAVYDAGQGKVLPESKEGEKALEPGDLICLPESEAQSVVLRSLLKPAKDPTKPAPSRKAKPAPAEDGE